LKIYIYFFTVCLHPGSSVFDDSNSQFTRPFGSEMKRIKSFLCLERRCWTILGSMQTWVECSRGVRATQRLLSSLLSLPQMLSS